MSKSITIQYIAVEYTSTDGQIWECSHITRSPEVDEITDEYISNVLGKPLALTYEHVEVCDECGDVERLDIERGEDEC